MKTEAPAIATTELLRIRQNGERIAIRVEVGQPIHSNDGFWHTPVALHGYDGRLADICGEDSLQSLSLAVEMVHRRLEAIIQNGDRLVLDDENGDDFPLGSYFPKA